MANNKFKGHLRYKTVTSQNVPPEANIKFFCFTETLCPVLEIFKFLYFQPPNDLPNL